MLKSASGPTSDSGLFHCTVSRYGRSLRVLAYRHTSLSCDQTSNPPSVNNSERCSSRSSCGTVFHYTTRRETRSTGRTVFSRCGTHLNKRQNPKATQNGKREIVPCEHLNEGTNSTNNLDVCKQRYATNLTRDRE